MEAIKNHDPRNPVLRQTKQQDPDDPPQQAPERYPCWQVERAGREVRGGRIA